MSMNKLNLKNRIEERLFNGYVLEPIPIIVVASIVGIALISLAIWGTWEAAFPKKGTLQSTNSFTIISYALDGPIYILETDDGYSLDLTKGAITSKHLLDELIRDHAAVVIKYEFNPSKRVARYTVLEIVSSDGHVIVPRSVVYNEQSKAIRNSLVVLWGLCFAYLTFILVAYYILCHAPQYPRAASILVRGPYRKF